MLTPLEVENKKFRKTLRGYSVDDVDDFMSSVTQSYGQIYKENLANKDKVGILTEAVRQYKSMEETLQNAIIVAQSTGEEVKRNAYEKAENIIREAENRADQIVSEASKEATKVSYEYTELRRQVDVFKARIISLLTSQLDIIKEFSVNDEKNSEKDNFDSLDEISVQEANEEIDIPKMIEDIERITKELPKITLNENGEYVSQEESSKLTGNN